MGRELEVEGEEAVADEEVGVEAGLEDMAVELEAGAEGEDPGAGL